jgi:MraZ protein
MFTGEYRHIIDTKKRLAIPVKFRRELNKKVVITRGLDQSLFLYPQKDWKTLAAKLSKLPFSKSDARSFSRLMLAGAMEVELDKAGRILIPDYLKVYAHLKKSIAIVGVYNRIEIWDEETWNKYRSQAEKNVEDISERLGELGL